MPKTCEKPFYKNNRFVLCKNSFQKNTKYSRNEIILEIDHLAKALAFARYLHDICGLISMVKKIFYEK